MKNEEMEARKHCQRSIIEANPTLKIKPLRKEGAQRKTELATKINLQKLIVYIVLPLFALQSLGAFVIVFSVAAGWLKLSDSLLELLLHFTYAQLAAFVLIVIRSLFRK
jgi:hypothetical protein